MEKRENISKIIIIIFLISFIWTLLQFLAPIMLESGSVEDLSGLTGLKDNEEAIKKMDAPWNYVYSIGDRLCHQKASRSFFINGNQMPFCARCTAIWIGITIGLGFMLFYKIALDKKLLILMIIGLIPIGIDGTGQLLGFWESTNLTRVITGLLIGVITGLAIIVIMDETRDILNKKKQKLIKR